jgi:hypothetical protein
MELLIGLMIAMIVGAFTYKDAKARGMNGILWGVLVTASMFPCLIIYFIIRKAKLPEHNEPQGTFSVG